MTVLDIDIGAAVSRIRRAQSTLRAIERQVNVITTPAQDYDLSSRADAGVREFFAGVSYLAKCHVRDGSGLVAKLDALEALLRDEGKNPRAGAGGIGWRLLASLRADVAAIAPRPIKVEATVRPAAVSFLHPGA